MSELGAAHRRLGDVEDRQRVGQLTLVGDDERQRGGDAPGQREVVQAGRRLPRPLEVDAGRAQIAELAAGHAEGPSGDRRVRSSSAMSSISSERSRTPLGSRCTARTSASASSTRPGIDMERMSRHRRCRSRNHAGMDPLPEPLVSDFDGPLGLYEEAFDRRRIAVAMDEGAGRRWSARTPS